MLLFMSSRHASNSLNITMYKTIILPVVLFLCVAWSFTLRKECRLRVFENVILKRIFGPKRDENGKWRRLHIEELRNLYRYTNIIRVNKSRRLRWAGHYWRALVNAALNLQVT